MGHACRGPIHVNMYSSRSLKKSLVAPMCAKFPTCAPQHRGVKVALSQDAQCAALLPAGTNLFGQSESDGERGPRRSAKAGAGVRAVAAGAASLPPLTHADLIASLRSATAGL